MTPKFAPILIQYKESIGHIDAHNKVFDFKRGEDVNPVLGKLSKRITGAKYTPTHFSNSFIKRCLNSSHDVESISKLLLESPLAILIHSTSDPEIVYERQKSIVEKAFNR